MGKRERERERDQQNKIKQFIYINCQSVEEVVPVLEQTMKANSHSSSCVCKVSSEQMTSQPWSAFTQRICKRLRSFRMYLSSERKTASSIDRCVERRMHVNARISMQVRSHTLTQIHTHTPLTLYTYKHTMFLTFLYCICL